MKTVFCLAALAILFCKVVAPEDVEVWTTTRAGTWPMAGGVTLEVKGEVFHGADVMTTAVLRWPTQEGGLAKNAVIHVAADAFGNRQPWAMAWESDKKIIWITTGDLRSWKDHDKKATAREVRRVDFRDSRHIIETRFSGWPQQDGPSAECIAAVDEVMSVEPDGDVRSRWIQWATSNAPDRHTHSMLSIYIYLDKDDGTIRIGNAARHPLTNLSEILRDEAAKKTTQWRNWIERISPSQQAALDQNAMPHAVIVAQPGIRDEIIEKVIGACRAAGVGP